MDKVSGRSASPGHLAPVYGSVIANVFSVFSPRTLRRCVTNLPRLTRSRRLRQADRRAPLEDDVRRMPPDDQDVGCISLVIVVIDQSYTGGK